MGFDVNRFEERVDDELICPVCTSVLEEPLQAPQCEHAFCAGCIREWLSRQPTCPIDRLPITASQLQPVPRIMRNLLSRLKIYCDNAQFGCGAVLKLDALRAHEEECEHNPKRPVACAAGCGLVIPKNQLKSHNCVRELRSAVQNQQSRIGELQAEVNKVFTEINTIKEYICSLRLTGATIPTLMDSMEQEPIVRWASSLPRARVTRWGGMISTPDSVLQSLVKHCLIQSGCPQSIIEDLILNGHERRWPPGLRSLETRQRNRRIYENYVCRRVPGKQAVVVMACDNYHMHDDMILKPGLVMIFAHGIE